VNNTCTACAQVQAEEEPKRWWQWIGQAILVAIAVGCGIVGAVTIGFFGIVLWVTS